MRHALIIEDELVIALEIQALLQDFGFDTVDIAVSPAEAVACACGHAPDLITADYRIEGGTGVEAVEMVLRRCAAAPVVYVTGNADQVRGLGAPVVDKPISIGSFRRALAAAGAAP